MTLPAELRAERESGLLVLRVMKPGTLAYETQHRINELLHRAADALEWRGIESAPRDREVLVWREDSGSFIAKLTTPDGVIPDNELEGMDFPDDYEEWWSDAYGWQEGNEKPTHWLPLPATPEGDL